MRYTIVDIETRIDKGLVRSVYVPGSPAEQISDGDAFGVVRKQLKNEQGNDFFPLAFHIPISIAVGQVDDARVLTGVETIHTEDGCQTARSEEALVRAFWDRTERFSGALVTFNGRGFDLPVLELQALKYGLSIPHYFQGQARYRFSNEGHYDLYDFITNYGAHRLKGGFNALAKLIGLPGKTDVDGSMVQELWEQGELEQIDRYCRSDVIQTYFLFLRLELLKGRITREEHETIRELSQKSLPE